ncbi:MAG: DUF4190 domain-containing protein [Chloroflexi bacterium]|nr:DUF4190 domain-containing protein [Chloroflexota bacterium]
MTNQPYQTPPVQNSTLAMVSLIAGIAGWSLVPLIGSIVAVITGHMAKKEIRESNGMLGGDGMATVGLILGYASIGLAALGICAALLFAVAPLCLIPIFGDFQFIAPLLGF